MKAQLAVALTAAVLLIGCGKTTTEKPTGAAALTPEQVETKLAAADLADGAADKVVAKCAACRLGMDGSPEHASTHAGYELHFCSEDCKTQFDHDPAKVIGRLPDKPLA